MLLMQTSASPSVCKEARFPQKRWLTQPPFSNTWPLLRLAGQTWAQRAVKIGSIRVRIDLHNELAFGLHYLLYRFTHELSIGFGLESRQRTWRDLPPYCKHDSEKGVSPQNRVCNLIIWAFFLKILNNVRKINCLLSLGQVLSEKSSIPWSNFAMILFFQKCIGISMDGLATLREAHRTPRVAIIVTKSEPGDIVAGGDASFHSNWF